MTISDKVVKSQNNAYLFAKWELTHRGYSCAEVSRKKDTKRERSGSVDLIAAKYLSSKNKTTGKKDILRIILIDVKGGSSPITKQQEMGLKEAANNLKIDWCFTVKRKAGKSVKFIKEGKLVKV